MHGQLGMTHSTGYDPLTVGVDKSGTYDPQKHSKGTHHPSTPQDRCTLHTAPTSADQAKAESGGNQANARQGKSSGGERLATLG